MNVVCMPKAGSTPLHYSSQSGHFDVTELLIKKGAQIDIRNKVSAY